MKRLLLIFIFISGFTISFSESIIERRKHAIQGKEIKETKAPLSFYATKFEEVIDFIKVHEGFRANVYGDLNGLATIGHGLVTKYIDKRFRKYITLEQSDSIVRAKINRNIKLVDKKYPNLNEYQNLMVAHLIYCKGLGNIQKHPIHKQLKNGYINKNTLLYFSNYEVERSHYRKTRRFEWELWNFNIKTNKINMNKKEIETLEELEVVMKRKAKIYNPNITDEYFDALPLIQKFRDMHPIDRASLKVTVNKFLSSDEIIGLEEPWNISK